ncbi:MAG: YlmH/Sll1252 family protein [Bacillota bacterium]|nr:YlmH/Sll1252 family protein [Bacillota bacterium]
MEVRDLLSNIVKDASQREQVQIILDKAARAGKNHKLMITDFLEPGIIGIAIPFLKNLTEIKYQIAGGYHQAERARLIFMPAWDQQDETSANISFIIVEGNNQLAKLSHRDFLGALIGLGIKREKIGDLLLVESGCQVILDSDFVDYIRFNLTKVGSLKVNVRELIKDQLVVPSDNSKAETKTVASLRLDVILAAGFNISRDKAAAYIQGEKVKLNHIYNNNNACQVKEGDLISCRGKGRLQLIEVSGETKKGRIKIIFNKYA